MEWSTGSREDITNLLIGKHLSIRLCKSLFNMLVSISSSRALFTGIQSKSSNTEVNFILWCSLKYLKQHLDRIGLILFRGGSITPQWSVFFSALKRKGSLNRSGWFLRQLSKMEVRLVAKFTMGTRPDEVERQSRSNRFRSLPQSIFPFGCMSRNVSQRSMMVSIRSPSSYDKYFSAYHKNLLLCLYFRFSEERLNRIFKQPWDFILTWLVWN